MRLAREAQRPALFLLSVHDAALLLAIFYAPIYWGQFATSTFPLTIGSSVFGPSGLGLTTLLVSVAALAALVWRWAAGRGPAVIPNAMHLPALAFVAISALATLTSVAIHFSTLELTRIVVGALFFLLVANRALLPAAPVEATLGLFVASLPLTLFAQAAGETSWTLDLLIWLAGGAVAVLLYTHRDAPDPVRRWAEALVLSSGLVVGIWGTREGITVGLTGHDWGWAIFSTFFNANPLGGFCTIVLPLAVMLALTGRFLWQRLLLGFAALAIGPALFFTHSKGAFLGLGASAVVFLLLWARVSRRPRRNVALAAAGLAVVVLLVGTLTAASPGLRAKAFGAFGQQRAPNMFRLLAWQGTWRMARHHPVLGVGPGAFESAFMNYAVAGYTKAAHENFLQVASEQGFPGLVAFVWLFAAALFTAGRVVANDARPRPDRLLAAGLASGLVAFLVHSLFDYDWYLGAVGLALWFNAGYLAHLAHGRALALLPAPAKPEPAKTKRRRAEERAPVKPLPEAPVHPLPWPRAEAGRAVVVLAVAGVLGVFFWLSVRSARAQNAREQADSAASAFQEEVAQAQAQGTRSELAGYYVAQAEDGYRRATQYDPTWAEAHELYAKFLEGTDPAAAERELKTAVADEPMNFRPRVTLANFYDGQRRWSEARTAYEDALKYFPQHTRALHYLAHLYEEMGDEANALRTYRRLAALENMPIAKYPALSADTEVDTNFAFAHYAFGREALRTYLRKPDRKQLVLARTELRKCTNLIIEYRQGAAKMDAMFLAAGRPRISRSSELDPLEARARTRLATVLDLLGRHYQAQLERGRVKELLAQYPEVPQELAAEDARDRR